MLLSEQELSVQITDVNSVKVNLKQKKKKMGGL